jgi:hypothetical protein
MASFAPRIRFFALKNQGFPDRQLRVDRVSKSNRIVLVPRNIYSQLNDELRHGLFPKDDISEKDSIPHSVRYELSAGPPLDLIDTVLRE